MLYSKMETFGVALAEALSCGVPVIAGNIGGPNDFVDDSNGILVPPDNPMALHDAMKLMLEKAESYDREKIRARIVERYDRKVIVRRLESIYRQALGGRT